MFEQFSLRMILHRVKALDYRVRERLGEAALAFAESDDGSISARVRNLLVRIFPSIEACVNALRLVRKNQSEATEESIADSRIPDGIQIRFLGFCILEVLTVEDFRRLETSVSFFPIESLFVSMIRKGRTANLDDESDLLRHQVPGGIIVKDKSLLDPGALTSLLGADQIGHSMMPSRVIKTLPDTVLFVQVFPVQVLPSLFTISVYVHLTAAAAEELLNLHNAAYRPPFILKGLSAEKIIRASPHKLDSDLLRKRQIQQWKRNLRGEIETAVRPLLSGYFSNLTKTSRGAALPTIDVYSLRGAPTIPDAMEDWKQFYDWTSSSRTLGWGDPLGLDFVLGESYVSNLAHFQWGNDVDGRHRPVSHLVLWEEPCKEKLTAEAANNDWLSQSRSAMSLPGADPVMEYACKMLGVMKPGLVVVRVLQGLQLSLDRLRLLAFSRLSKKLSLRVGFRLINSITREALLLDRIAGEFRKERFWPMGLFDLTLFDVQRLRKPGGPDENFTTETEKDITETTDLLKTSSSQVQRWLGESLSLRNTKAIFWLSVVGMFVAVISLISGWESLAGLTLKIFHLMSNR